jgi:two-component system chemotaxis response regulator CheY
MSRILIVEDAAYVREVYRHALTSHNYDVAGEASNGAEAVDKYRALKPDAVIMDLLLPVMDGISAIKRIREFDPQARIVVVSAIMGREVKQDAIRAGAIEFVPKPFDMNSLLRAIGNAALSGAHASRPGNGAKL